jgi:putative aldouronate transport system permease protein
MSVDQMAQFGKVSDRTVKAAQVFLGCMPVLLVYPFLQRYFTKGLVLGSVKG